MCVNFCSFSFFISEGGQGEIFAGKASNVPSLCAGKWPSKRGYENAMRLYRRRAIDRSKCHMRFRCFRERACVCVSVCLCMCTLTQHQGGAVMNFVLFAFFFLVCSLTVNLFNCFVVHRFDFFLLMLHRSFLVVILYELSLASSIPYAFFWKGTPNNVLQLCKHLSVISMITNGTHA